VVVGAVAGLLQVAWAFPPVRSALSRRARRAWSEGGEVLFLCSGNIWRSPFAEAVVRVTQPDRRVRSAGFFPQPGRPSPPEAVALAAERWGIDLSEHRSAVVDGVAVAHAGAIFLFDAGNVLLLARRHPTALRRAHLVGALDPDGPLLIADPHIASREAQCAILDLAANAIAAANLVRLARDP
jgi:protein-tyrosine phosphatase